MKKALILSLLFIVSISMLAQESNIEWKIDQSREATGSHSLIISAEIPNTWYIYGMNMDEGGPLPLHLSFEDSKNLLHVVEFKEISKPKEMYDDVFKMNVNSYMEKVEIKCVFVPKSDVTKINLIIDGQACNKKDGSCVQVYENIEIEILK